MKAQGMTLSIETMNQGTEREFQRVFIRCDLGHDLYSLSLESLQRHPIEFDTCRHYAHKEVVA